MNEEDNAYLDVSIGENGTGGDELVEVGGDGGLVAEGGDGGAEVVGDDEEDVPLLGRGWHVVRGIVPGEVIFAYPNCT